MNIGQTPEEGEELITDYGGFEGEYVFYTGEEHSSFIRRGNGALWFGSSALADCDEESFDDESSKIGRKICETLALEGIEANPIQPCKLAVCLDYSYKDCLSFILITQITPRSAARPPRLVHMHQLAHGAQRHSVPERSLAA
jgi:hypothetical protein